jgi:DNA-binding FadR family transcriptional regulator
MHESMQESMRVGLLKRKVRRDVVKVIESHELIVDAIEQGEAGLAGVLMKKHFDDAQAALARVQDE